MAFGTDRSAETMWSLLSVCPLRPPTDVAIAAKSGWILSMLPPVVAVLGLLYCANFASVILGEVRNTHTKRNSILNRISGRDKGNLLHPAGYGETASLTLARAGRGHAWRKALRWPRKAIARFRAVSTRRRNADVVFRFAVDSPLERDGFEPSVPDRIYSAAMRSQVISRCSSLSPVRRGGGMRTMRSPSKRTPRT